MIRKEAVRSLVLELVDLPIISANGFISRDLFETGDKKNNFYMIGSMGLASSIGLGVSLKNPKKKICIFDGDGNILMNLGSLVTISSLRPKNFLHFIFDNGIHESTGGQPTNSSSINMRKLCQSLNLKFYEISTVNQIHKMIPIIKNDLGPIIIHIKIEKGGGKSKRITFTPKKIKERFMLSIKK